MPEPYRILVTAWRHAGEQHRPYIVRNLAGYGVPRRSHNGITLVHGDAPGGDRIAKTYAEARGWTVEDYPAEQFGSWPACGPRRNAHMVSTGADVCIAFPGPGSTGTWDCIKKAAKAGIVTHIYPLAVADA